MQISIKWKAAAAATLFAVVSVAIIGAIQLRMIESDLREVLSDQQFGLVTKTAADLDSKFISNVDVLVRSAGGISQEALGSETKFREYYAARPALFSLFDDLILAAPNGALISDLPQVPGRLGSSFADRAFFWEVVKNKQPAISEPLLGKVSKQPIVQIGVPVLDRNGNLAAVLVGVLRLTKRNFLGNLAEAKIGKTGYFVLMTKGANPVYVVHPDISRLLQPVAADSLIIKFGGMNGFEGTVEDTAATTKIHVLASIKSLKVKDWLLVAVMAADEAFVPIQKARLRNLILLTLVVFILGPLVWLGTWRLMGPLTRLHDGIRRNQNITSEFVPVLIERNDEVGAIAEDFNALMSERSNLSAQLRQLAHFDSLTGVPNRALFFDRAARALVHARRANSLCALFYLDLDGFKKINDTLGHATGDELLKGFAQRLQSLVREGDTVARLGGDEFVVLLEQLHRVDDAYRIAQNILDAMRRPFNTSTEPITAGTSIGIAFQQVDEPVDTLVARADAALYDAKRSGRGVYRVAAPLEAPAWPDRTNMIAKDAGAT